MLVLTDCFFVCAWLLINIKLKIKCNSESLQSKPFRVRIRLNPSGKEITKRFWLPFASLFYKAYISKMLDVNKKPTIFNFKLSIQKLKIAEVMCVQVNIYAHGTNTKV
jgi:hypothetical protein